jgi:hypothetical protein
VIVKIKEVLLNTTVVQEDKKRDYSWIWIVSYFIFMVGLAVCILYILLKPCYELAWLAQILMVGKLISFVGAKTYGW